MIQTPLQLLSVVTMSVDRPHPRQSHDELLVTVRSLFENQSEKLGTADAPTKAGFVALANKGRETWNAWRIQWPEPRADFSGVDFSAAPVDFSGYQLRRPQEFKDDGPDFRHCLFGDSVRFDGALFGANTTFDGCNFTSGASFDAARFGDHASFNFVQFGGKANFRGAGFCNFSSFVGAEFRDGADFALTEFGSHTRFEQTRFSRGSRLQGCTVRFLRSIRRSSVR